MPRVYMRFEWLNGWRVSFLDGTTLMPRKLNFQDVGKLFELAERGGGLKTLADRQALDHALQLGRGGIHLELSHSQFVTLQRHKPLQTAL